MSKADWSNPGDKQIDEWARAAGLHIATHFDREMFRKFALVVINTVLPEEPKKATK